MVLYWMRMFPIGGISEKDKVDKYSYWRSESMANLFIFYLKLAILQEHSYIDVNMQAFHTAK